MADTENTGDKDVVNGDVEPSQEIAEKQEEGGQQEEPQEEESQEVEAEQQEEESQEPEAKKQEEGAPKAEEEQQEEESQEAEAEHQEEDAPEAEEEQQEEDAPEAEAEQQEEESQEVEAEQQEDESQKVEAEKQEESQEPEAEKQEEESQELEAEKQDEASQEIETEKQEGEAEVSTKEDNADVEGKQEDTEQQEESPKEVQADDDGEKVEETEDSKVDEDKPEMEAKVEDEEEREDETVSPRVTSLPPSMDKKETMEASIVTEKIDDSETVLHIDKTGLSPAPTKVNLEATATVKLILVPSGQVVTMALALETTPQGIREILSKELKIPPNVIQVLFNGVPLDDNFTIEHLGIEVNGTVAFEIASSDPEKYPIKTYVSKSRVEMPDVITVRISFEDGTSKDVIVEIERSNQKKPFLGGYRHKKTGKEFHHASAQTVARARPMANIDKYTRDTQTFEYRHKVQQTFNTTSTQMTMPGFYVSNVEDKLFIPGKYETAEQYNVRKLKKIIIIQTYYRRWLAKQHVCKLRHGRDAMLNWEEEQEIKKRKEKEDRIRKEFERRMNPKGKEDFDLLYGALEKWRQEELHRINATLSGAERKAALCLLLNQETELIAAIDRHQLDASVENKEKVIQQLLGKAAAAKKWRSDKGHTLQMDTAYTLRARELLDIYNSLNMKYLTQDERLDVLLTLKHTVKEHDCKLTQEVVELIDREADLLMRGVKEDNLVGLRNRISNLFLQYCKTPTFNPEITRLLKVPQDVSTLKQNIHYCNSCGRYLRSSEFSLGIKSTGMGRCRRCLRKDNLARVRQDQSAYKHLLQELRKGEEAHQDGSRIAFLIEEADLRYLVENIWESMSILSSWDDLADLVLVRWNMDEEWSPWNTVLLTKDESNAHGKLTNLQDAYGDMLIHRVEQKHVLADNYFAKLKKMADRMQKKKQLTEQSMQSAQVECA